LDPVHAQGPDALTAEDRADILEETAAEVCHSDSGGSESGADGGAEGGVKTVKGGSQETTTATTTTTAPVDLVLPVMGQGLNWIARRVQLTLQQALKRGVAVVARKGNGGGGGGGGGHEEGGESGVATFEFVEEEQSRFVITVNDL
jgi:hypothetical protein